MKRILLAVAVLLLTLVGLLLPATAAFETQDSSTTPDPVTITDYKADFTLAKDGRLGAVESITADFPGGRHGIFRFWDLKDPSNSHTRLEPKDIAISLDGEPVPFEKMWENGRRLGQGSVHIKLRRQRHV